MDFDEIEDLFNDDREESETTSRPPDFRATIRDGLVTIVNWAPWLLNGGGPSLGLVRDRAKDGVTLADLWLNGDDTAEIIVEYLAVADRRRADRLLTRWAESVGYDRLWLPDRLVSFPSGRPLGSARVVCPTCGVTWEDSTPDFWSNVRKSGRFPPLCSICNSDLPQWDWRRGRRARHGVK